MLGNNLAYLLKDRADVVGVYNSHHVSIRGVELVQADLNDYQQARALMVARQPDVVIHCASRTDVDCIEKDKDRAWQSNVIMTRNLVDSLRDSNAKFVYISSDSVYSGHQQPISEENSPAPRNWYGTTKLEGELAALGREGALVLRTNLFGWNLLDKKGVGEWFLDSALSGQECNGFTDVYFSSIYTFLLGDLIWDCIRKELAGVYNCASRDWMSKAQFGRELMVELGYEPSLVKDALIDDMAFDADRGKMMGLDVSRLEAELGYPLPRMKDSIEAFCRDYRNGLHENMQELITETVHERSGRTLSYGSQTIDADDISAVVEVLNAPFLTQGPKVKCFEAAVAGRCRVEHAIAVNSGTAALHLACLACGVGEGDEVVTSANTFLASANCALYCGGRPVFTDIDPFTYNMTPETLAAVIGPKTKVVIPVHFAGQSCDMKAIREVVSSKEQEYGNRIFIIEDASHALGSNYMGNPVGCCQFSDFTVFSFHPVKHITTGEGGMVVTPHSEQAEVVRSLRSHGVTKNAEEMDRSDGSWYYEQVRLGFNYRITDILCALGLSQLGKLDDFIQQRAMLCKMYVERLQDLDFVKLPRELKACSSNYHLFVPRIDFAKTAIGRSSLFKRLNKDGIYPQVHYIPLSLQPYYQGVCEKLSPCPEAEDYYQECISLPLFPGLTEGDVDYVVDRLVSHLTPEKLDGSVECFR